MASQRRNRTQADADKTARTRVLNRIKAGPVLASQLPPQWRRFLRDMETEGLIYYTDKGWQAK